MISPFFSLPQLTAVFCYSRPRPVSYCSTTASRAANQQGQVPSDFKLFLGGDRSIPFGNPACTNYRLTAMPMAKVAQEFGGSTCNRKNNFLMCSSLPLDDQSTIPIKIDPLMVTILHLGGVKKLVLRCTC